MYHLFLSSLNLIIRIKLQGIKEQHKQKSYIVKGDKSTVKQNTEQIINKTNNNLTMRGTSDKP